MAATITLSLSKYDYGRIRNRETDIRKAIGKMTAGGDDGADVDVEVQVYGDTRRVVVTGTSASAQQVRDRLKKSLRLADDVTIVSYTAAPPQLEFPSDDDEDDDDDDNDDDDDDDDDDDEEEEEEEEEDEDSDEDDDDEEEEDEEEEEDDDTYGMESLSLCSGEQVQPRNSEWWPYAWSGLPATPIPEPAWDDEPVPDPSWSGLPATPIPEPSWDDGPVQDPSRIYFYDY